MENDTPWSAASIGAGCPKAPAPAAPATKKAQLTAKVRRKNLSRAATACNTCGGRRLFRRTFTIALVVMSVQFSGEVVLVAGGTGALGRAVSLAFLEQRAKVVVTYRDTGEFDELKRAGTSALQGQQVDVTNDAAMKQFVQAVVAEHGRLDIVVNTVGAFAGGGKLWEEDARVLEQMLSTNLRSGYAISRAVVPQMLKQEPLGQKRGVLINIASRAAIDHGPSVASYAASKAA